MPDIPVITTLRAGGGSHLASVDLWRLPGGEIAAVLTDMPAHVIDNHGDSPADRLRLLADWLEAGAKQMREHQAPAITNPSM